MTRTRDLVALGAAVVACTAMVLAPPVVRSRPPSTVPGTLAAAWPKAHPFDLPGTVLAGQSYEPQVIVAAGVSIGTAKTPDGNAISLVEVTSTGTPATVRVLQGGLSSSTVSYDAFAVTGHDVYVMRDTTDTDGYGTESLWRIPRAAGPPVLVVPDAGETLFQGSINDLQVAGRTLRWVATAPHHPSETALTSMRLPAGPVTVRRLPGQYTLSTYPMLLSGQPLELTDATNGQITRVRATTPPGTVCDPVWCVMQSPDDTGADTVRLCHPDGTGLVRIGDADTNLVATDPTLLDRYVAWTDQSPAMAATPDPTEQLWLYDIARKRSVEIAAAATGTVGAGGWLWWSTGDNETLTWHALDLTTLR
jgi:hypothetical protein